MAVSVHIHLTFYAHTNLKSKSIHQIIQHSTIHFPFPHSNDFLFHFHLQRSADLRWGFFFFFTVYYVGKTTIKIKSKSEQINCVLVSSVAAICVLIKEPSLGNKTNFLFWWMFPAEMKIFPSERITQICNYFSGLDLRQNVVYHCHNGTCIHGHRQDFSKIPAMSWVEPQRPKRKSFCWLKIGLISLINTQQV